MEKKEKKQSAITTMNNTGESTRKKVEGVTVQASGAAAGATVEEQVMAAVSELKEAVERRDQRKLESLLAGSTLWLGQRPGTVAELNTEIGRLTADSHEIRLSLVKILELKMGAEKAALSGETQLIWTNVKTWEEDTVNLDLHMGLVKTKDTWKIEYFGVTYPKIKDEPLREVGKELSDADRLKEHTPGVEEIKRVIDESLLPYKRYIEKYLYFERVRWEDLIHPPLPDPPPDWIYRMAKQYSEPTTGAPTASETVPTRRAGKLVPVFMPVLLPSSYLKDLLGD